MKISSSGRSRTVKNFNSWINIHLLYVSENVQLLQQFLTYTI